MTAAGKASGTAVTTTGQEITVARQGQEYEARCEACGKVFRASSKEQAANDLRTHGRESHGVTMTQEQAEQKVKMAA